MEVNTYKDYRSKENQQKVRIKFLEVLKSLPYYTQEELCGQIGMSRSAFRNFINDTSKRGLRFNNLAKVEAWMQQQEGK